MATLVEGREYGLASNVSTSGNKTFIHFKLTDSALRALEEFSKIKTGCSRSPTIEFNGNNGVMRIPAQASSDDPKAERNFQLTLTKILGDDYGSFDCVQQTAIRQGSSLQCLGSMHYKVATNANNDVYTDTRKKITLADSELKKSCAKEIKMSGRYSGKKIKKVIPGGTYKALQPQISKPTPNAARATPPSISPLTTNSHHSNSAALNHLTPPSLGGHSPHRSNSHPVNGTRTATKPAPVSNGSSAQKAVSQSNRPTSGVINMPYKDRVIHVLALRPYKKPELLTRLNREGIREKDRNSLGPILQQVATLKKDNSYSLARHLWSEVRSDWPYYTDADRERLKKNLQIIELRGSVSPAVNTQNLESHVSTPPTLSPVAKASDSPSSPQKRPVEDVTEILPSKKQRISHHEKLQQHHRTNGKVPNGIHNGVVTSLHKDKSNNNNNTITTVLPSATKVDKKFSPIPESPSSNTENQEKGHEHDDSIVPDYVLQYRSIEDGEQRMQYKQDFNHEYEEYRRLHEKVQNVALRFHHLRERISNAKEGTQDYEELKNRVLQEYQQQKNDRKFQERKRRVDYLHGKLGHIKRLIHEFDQQHQLSTCS